MIGVIFEILLWIMILGFAVMLKEMKDTIDDIDYMVSLIAYGLKVKGIVDITALDKEIEKMGEEKHGGIHNKR